MNSEAENNVIKFFKYQPRRTENRVRYAIDCLLLDALIDFGDTSSNGFTICEIIDKIATSTGTSLQATDVINHHKQDQTEQAMRRRGMLSGWGVHTAA